jgi:polysaccharide deacetylase 2 family uncharacterized protein YibQ
MAKKNPGGKKPASRPLNSVGRKPVQKRASKSKSGSRGRKASAGGESTFLRAVVGVALMLCIVYLAGMLVYKHFPPDKLKGLHSGKSRQAAREKQKDKPTGKGGKDDEFPQEVIRYEIYPKEEPASPPRHEPKEVLPPREPGRKPDVAIIIDDIGFRRDIARKLEDLDSSLTFSVLPQSPHRQEIAHEAHNKGLEIMLHLPMEPIEYPKENPGPGALLVSMDVDEMIAVLNDDLEDIPYAVGVNNHMGSRLTCDSSRMNQVFSILKKRGLFFIDSRTAGGSQCRSSARLLQISFGERDVFLDNDEDPEMIRKQVKTLLRVAEKHGRAIGIGHPYPATVAVLTEEFPEIERRVRLVHASELVRVLE